MFSYIKRSNHTLIVLNLLLMLVVVVLPFPASLLALYLQKPQQQTAVAVYSGVLAAGGVIYNLPWLYASAGHRLIDRNLDKQAIKQITLRYAAGPCLYGVAFVLSFFWNGTLGLIACALLALGYLLPSVADRVRLTSPDRPGSRLPQGPSAHPKIAARPAVLRAEQERPSTKRQVLLTGAAGGIGSAFFQHAASTYAFRLADRVPLDLMDTANQGHETMLLDIADLAACQQACRGIDTVVHLAADPSPEADFATSLLSNNILGTYNILRAAKDQGCRRVILASSVQVVLGHALDIQTNSSTPARPMNMYGVSKCFVEDVATYFAYAEKLSCIAIRIGAYDVGNDHAKWLRDCPHPLDRTVYVSPRDLNQLLERCIDVADVPFAIVDGLSNNLFKRADLTATRELLGYQPEDDAFEIFKDNSY